MVVGVEAKAGEVEALDVLMDVVVLVAVGPN